MNKNIKLLIENIFQREGARELLKRSKYEEIVNQISRMPFACNTELKSVLYNKYKLLDFFDFKYVKFNEEEYMYDQFIFTSKQFTPKGIAYQKFTKFIKNNNFKNVYYVPSLTIQYLKKMIRCYFESTNKNPHTEWEKFLTMNDIEGFFKKELQPLIEDIFDNVYMVKHIFKCYIQNIQKIYETYYVIDKYPFLLSLYVSDDDGLCFIKRINDDMQRFDMIFTFTGNEKYFDLSYTSQTNINKQKRLVNKRIKRLIEWTDKKYPTIKNHTTSVKNHLYIGDDMYPYVDIPYYVDIEYTKNEFLNTELEDSYVLSNETNNTFTLITADDMLMINFSNKTHKLIVSLTEKGKEDIDKK